MVNGKYAVKAIEAEVVRQIFEQYLGGKSLKAIAAEMTVPYISGKLDWNKNMVCRVLENTKYILTKSLSRFARNTVDSLNYIRELKLLGIAVIFEKESINTLATESEMLTTIMSCFAQAESESISKNVS